MGHSKAKVKAYQGIPVFCSCLTKQSVCNDNEAIVLHANIIEIKQNKGHCLIRLLHLFKQIDNLIKQIGYLIKQIATLFKQ